MTSFLNLRNNTGIVEASFADEKRGPILNKISEGFISRSVIYGVIFALLYMVVFNIYLLETGRKEHRELFLSTFSFILSLIVIYRFLELKLLYRSLKKTFDTNFEFISFLSAIACNKYTRMSNVSIDSVLEDIEKIEKGGSKTIFFFKYFYILTLNRSKVVLNVNKI